MQAFLNGDYIPADQLSLPIHDAGLVLGASVTDLCRTFRHRLFRWPQHLDRFRRSCLATGIFPTLSEQEIASAAAQLVEHNATFLTANADLALVMLATPGPIGFYLGENSGPGDAPPTFAMHTFPLPLSRYRPLFERGAVLAIPNTRQVPAECIDPRIKQRSRLHWWLAEREVKATRPQASALLLNTDGFITETSAANFLIVKDGSVVSPPRDTILDGVSLSVTRALCSEIGVAFEEQPLRPYDCINADEAMLASTSYGLAGVSRINEQPIDWPGPVLNRLLDAWNAEAGIDIRRQILDSAGT